MNCVHEKNDELCGCGIAVGTMQMRRGVLCSVDARGRLRIRAPRRKDVALAQRVVAAVAGAKDDVSKQLTADLTGIRETA